ncbi:hypothetical protein LCGC14_2485440 [marine sediment metagenome]|uniref:Uncharacterized protein n=1 Tax=marine sediment metagenome TaxID=412755 RepID=A0A0F9DI86_9ZZZZ
MWKLCSCSMRNNRMAVRLSRAGKLKTDPKDRGKVGDMLWLKDKMEFYKWIAGPTLWGRFCKWIKDKRGVIR